jgi:hypothetical protein
LISNGQYCSNDIASSFVSPRPPKPRSIFSTVKAMSTLRHPAQARSPPPSTMRVRRRAVCPRRRARSRGRRRVVSPQHHARSPSHCLPPPQPSTHARSPPAVYPPPSTHAKSPSSCLLAAGQHHARSPPAVCPPPNTHAKSSPAVCPRRRAARREIASVPSALDANQHLARSLPPSTRNIYGPTYTRGRRALSTPRRPPGTT